MRALIVLLLVIGGCSEDPTYLIVEVGVRPSVHDVKKLKVTLSNAGSTRTDELDLSDKPFPVTFSIAATGRTGDLDIGVDGVDDAGALVGRGSSRTTIESPDVTSVLLDPADFVVNSTFAGNQYLSTDFEAVGLQLATISSGVWTAVFRDDCSACDIYGRRFDATGAPVESVLAASNLEFKVSSSPTTSLSFPAIASSGLNSIVAWDYFTMTNDGVACRGINDMGQAASNEVSLSTDPNPDVVTVTALSANSFIVTWQTFMSSLLIRGLIVDKNCTPVAGPNGTLPFAISTGTLAATRAHVAVNQTFVLYTWIVDNEVRFATANGTGPLNVGAQPLVPRTATEDVDFVRVSPWGTGFAVAVRWSTRSTMGPGKIEVYRVMTNGQIVGKPILITDKAGSDFASDHAFGIAHAANDSILVVWHWCETGMAGSCDIYGRILLPNGAAVGNEFVINTSTNGDQINPSVISVNDAFVAAWNDSSQIEPDRNGSAVRARVFYPLYDTARGVLGARCGSTAGGATCDDGLACATGTDAVARCYTSCTTAGMVCPNGGTCTMGDSALGCVF